MICIREVSEIDKRRPFKFILLAIVVCLLTCTAALADELAIGRFGSDGLSGWEPKVFKGVTEYSLKRKDGRTVVKAVSHAAASGLVRKVSFDPRKYRYLRWSWKIDHPIAAGDERTKSGDDYAARIYVVFKGRFFWQTKAINYIWANRLKRGESIPNAYTGNAMMLAIESGPARAGEWLSEERDILEDYRLLFGAEPGEADAIAIMTDTDNTGASAVAWYGDITLATTRR